MTIVLFENNDKDVFIQDEGIGVEDDDDDQHNELWLK